VEIRYDEVRGLVREGDRVVGVSLRRETVRAGSVLLAAGPWTGLMAEWTGWPIPVIPLRGEILHLRQPGPQLQCCIIRGGNYVLLKPDGPVTAGTTEERVGFRARPLAGGRAEGVVWLPRPPDGGCPSADRRGGRSPGAGPAGGGDRQPHRLP